MTVNDSIDGSRPGRASAAPSTSSAGTTSQMLSASDQSKAIDLLFGADAAHFAVGRIPIGASDYAISRYTDDEIVERAPTTLTSFSITEDMKYLIPYVKAAQAVEPQPRFWGSPWTPPTWMKTVSGTAQRHGVHCQRHRTSTAAA